MTQRQKQWFIRIFSGVLIFYLTLFTYETVSDIHKVTSKGARAMQHSIQQIALIAEVDRLRGNARELMLEALNGEKVHSGPLLENEDAFSAITDQLLEMIEDSSQKGELSNCLTDESELHRKFVLELNDGRGQAAEETYFLEYSISAEQTDMALHSLRIMIAKEQQDIRKSYNEEIERAAMSVFRRGVVTATVMITILLILLRLTNDTQN